MKLKKKSLILLFCMICNSLAYAEGYRLSVIGSDISLYADVNKSKSNMVACMTDSVYEFVFNLYEFGVIPSNVSFTFSDESNTNFKIKYSKFSDTTKITYICCQVGDAFMKFFSPNLYIEKINIGNKEYIIEKDRQYDFMNELRLSFVLALNRYEYDFCHEFED